MLFTLMCCIIACFAMAAVSIIDRDGADALIPEEQSQELFAAIPQGSAAMQTFRVTRMSRKQTRMPVMSALPMAYFINGDTGQKKTSNASWENKYLTAEEIAVIVPLPEAVLDDAEFDIWGEVKPRIVEAIGYVIDRAIVFGDNKPASWPTAIALAVHDAGNEFVRGSVNGQNLAQDLAAVGKLLAADGYEPNFWTGAPTMKWDFVGQKDDNGRPLFMSDWTNGNRVDSLLGERAYFPKNGAFPAAASEATGNLKADLVCGDGSQGIIAIRQDITTKLLDQAILQDTDGSIAYNLAQQDMVALRVTFRVAFQIANPVNRINAAATRYPFAVLRPASWTWTA